MNVRIPIEMDAEACRILQSDGDKLSRELQRALPGIEVTHEGGSNGSKDTVAIITATAALIGAATPILTQVISGYFATRGIHVELKGNAKAGTIEYKAYKI